jgi:peptide deformylase
MAILPISIFPDPILLKKSDKIKDPKSQEVRELILNMLETMKNSDGLGLAAPQVGKSLQLCVINFEGKTHILINPKISSKSWKKVVGEEGCLSFPGVFIPVKRHKKVTVKALDRNGKELVIKTEGMLSRVLQHEIDHLEGIPFTKRKAKIRKSKNNKEILWKKQL